PEAVLGRCGGRKVGYVVDSVLLGGPGLTGRVSARGGPFAGGRSLVSVLVVAAAARAGGAGGSLGAGEGDRDCAAPPPVGGVGATGWSSPVDAGRPRVVIGVRSAVAAARVGVVLCDA